MMVVGHFKAMIQFDLLFFYIADVQAYLMLIIDDSECCIYPGHCRAFTRNMISTGKYHLTVKADSIVKS
ncbi:hypothetical protein [Paenibacillus monticola]|uniref:Uncharacterized protein n=1 Tax=Paenibacillus monticola TaxID=2666075 RepID=A0A7X2L1X2_9BACL|nr:hypothetical protein [Paenibacillus monticola]MRN53829.1 hypothetical protein [Paenibacillus monticola]